MIYRYKMNSIYLQGLFGILFFMVSLIFGDWIIAAVGGFVAFVLIRDCIKMKETRIEVKKDRIEKYVGNNKVKSIKWNDFEYVTRTRKNTKWVVVGHLKDQITLRTSLNDLDGLTAEILAHLKDNKEVFIHHTIKKS